MSSSWQPKSGSHSKELEQSRYRQSIEPPFRVFYRLDHTQVLILHVMRTERLLRKDALAAPHMSGKK
jgi:plasmid stabilization system protein ParE